MTDFACVACRLGGTIAHAALGAQFQAASINWALIQLTTDNAPLGFRTDGTTTNAGNGNAMGLEDFAIFDSLLDNGLVQPGSLNTTVPSLTWAQVPGFLYDNNHYVSSSNIGCSIAACPGTNITNGAVAITDFTMKPVAPLGTLQAVIGTVGNPNVADGSPLFPWDADGNSISAGAYVGAMQP